MKSAVHEGAEQPCLGCHSADGKQGSDLDLFARLCILLRNTPHVHIEAGFQALQCGTQPGREMV